MVWSYSQYTEYEVSIYSKVFCLWFTKSSVFCGRIEPRIKTSSKQYQNKPKFDIWCDLTPIDWIWSVNWFRGDANLMITWSRNPHAKTPIPGKPSKSGLIEVWHKDNLCLGTNTIGNGNPHPTNIDSRTRSIRMTPWSQLFFDKSFSVL
jgi:hypothetical protein